MFGTFSPLVTVSSHDATSPPGPRFRLLSPQELSSASGIVYCDFGGYLFLLCRRPATPSRLMLYLQPPQLGRGPTSTGRLYTSSNWGSNNLIYRIFRPAHLPWSLCCCARFPFSTPSTIPTWFRVQVVSVWCFLWFRWSSPMRRTY